MIEIKELVIRAIIDTRAEKPRDMDSTDSETPKDECEVCEIIEQIFEDINKKNER